MKSGKIFTVLAVAAMACFAAFAEDDLQANPVPAIGQNAKDQKYFDASKKGPRVLFVGNSITLHGPRPQIGWTNNWGMAASSRDKDYVHLLQKKIKAKRGDAQCCLMQVADPFERNFYKKDWNYEKLFKWAHDFKPDVIVMYFGANVPHEEYSCRKGEVVRTFGEALELLVNYLDPEKKAHVIVAEGFYKRPDLEKEKKEFVAKRGCVYVEMDDINSRKEAHGRYNHPGDLGMQLIADRFWENMEKQISEITH